MLKHSPLLIWNRFLDVLRLIIKDLPNTLPFFLPLKTSFCTADATKLNKVSIVFFTFSLKNA
jgi:hypothetical protein